MTKITTKIILLASLLTLTSCSSAPIQTTIKNYGVTNVVSKHTKIVITQPKWTEENKQNYLDTSMISILTNELSDNGYTVLERQDFNTVVNEHVFDNDIGMKELARKFNSADYILIPTITKMYTYTSGLFWLIYNDTTTTVECRIDLKAINTRTGDVYTSSSEAVSKSNQKNFLFFGEYSINKKGLYQQAFESASNSAVSKLNLIR